jgi:hypothetical protein
LQSSTRSFARDCDEVRVVTSGPHLVLLNCAFLVLAVWDMWLVLLGGRHRPTATRADHE